MFDIRFSWDRLIDAKFKGGSTSTDQVLELTCWSKQKPETHSCGLTHKCFVTHDSRWCTSWKLQFLQENSDNLTFRNKFHYEKAECFCHIRFWKYKHTCVLGFLWGRPTLWCLQCWASSCFLCYWLPLI